MRSLLKFLLVGAVLTTALVVSAACGSQPAPAAPTQAPAPTQAAAPQTVAPTATQPAANAPAAGAAIGSDKQWSQDPAPSLSKSPAAAKVRHYQGDPNAPVVLIEVSDFQ